MRQFKPIVAAVAAAVISASALASSASAQDQPPLVEVRQSSQQRVDIHSASSADVNELLAPPVPAAMAQLASTIAERFESDPHFASVEVPMDRSEVIVRWFGEVPRELRNLLSDAPDVPSRVASVTNVPGEVRDYAHSLMKSDPRVTSVSVSKDASSVEVTYAPDSAEGDLDLNLLDRPTGVTVTIKQSDIISFATRQTDDTYHLGGARIYLFNDPYIEFACTSGFAVRKLNNPSLQGMLTAAHCGTVGSDWIVSDGTFAYPWGEITQRTTAYDGAVIDSSWSQPFIWTSTWNSSVYTPINGVQNPYIGQEICYSGSFSGLVCGSFVDDTQVVYALTVDPSVTGIKTTQAAGQPAAGNGDSGGPGYTLVSTADGYKRYAVSIISAGPTSTSSTTCQGVPGEAGPLGRKCSPVIYSTSVNDINTVLGWYVPTS